MELNFFQICDGDEKIGIGHVIRSIAIYNELCKRCFSVEFYYIGNSIEVLSLIKKNINSKDLFIAKHLEIIFSRIQFGAVIFLDIPQQILLQLSSRLKKRNLIVGFDLSVDLKFNNQVYFNVLPGIINTFKNNNLSTYEGPTFALLRENFRKYHLKSKIIKDKIKNILITFGGADPNHYTESIIESIPLLIDQGYKIHLIMPKERKIDIGDVRENNNLIIYNNFINVLDLAILVDLTICSGGGTLWEMCCIGCPMIATPQSENEDLAISYLQQKKACIQWIEKIFEGKKLLRLINKLNNDKQQRSLISKNGKKLVDGRGVERVVDIVIEKRRRLYD